MLVNLIGERYGKLTVIAELAPVLPTLPGRSKTRVWQCQCDCGRQSRVRMPNLRSGHTTSCGCLKVKNDPRTLDRTGQKIGHLLITGVARTRGINTTWWACSCDCGGSAELRLCDIRASKDCGCGIGQTEDRSTEEWLPVACTEGKYLVSSHGRVKSMAVSVGRVMEPYLNKKGYECIALAGLNGKKIRKPIHRLVAQAFIPNPEGKPQVNHKDGVKRNNRSSNLEWVTNQENRDHAVRTGLHRAPTPKLGSENNFSKLSECDVLEIVALKGVSSAKDVAARYGVGSTNIHKIWIGDTWSHLTGIRRTA